MKKIRPSTVRSVLTYWRSKIIEIFKIIRMENGRRSAIAYERFRLGNFSILDKWWLKRGGCTWRFDYIGLKIYRRRANYGQIITEAKDTMLN